MAGLFTYSLAGLGFLLIGTIESLFPSPTRLLPLRFLSTLLLSFLSILSSLLSLLSSLHSIHDPLGPSLPLTSLSACSLFLLYSLTGLLSLRPLLLPLPSSLLDLILFFAFSQEFLLFYLRRKDLDGIENRYFDLLLFPILICAVSTLLCLARPRSPFPRLARAAGLVLHGTWFVQMGFSLFSSAIAHGCAVHERSMGNYTVRCKGHPEYHRSRAIATLQFNCHLAFLVVVGVGVYSVVARRGNGIDGVGEGPKYRPLNKELQMENVSSQFTLDSDDEEEEIVAEANGLKQHDVVLLASGINGLSSSH